MEKLLYTKKEAAALLSLGCSSIDYLIARGELKVRRLGGAVRIPAGELLRLAKSDIPAIRTCKAERENAA